MRYTRVETEIELQQQLSAGHYTIAAGMTDVYPSGQMDATGRSVVDVSAIPSLRGIERRETGWWIGSTTRWSDVLRQPWQPGLALLAEVASQVGAVQVQNAATVGGNLCNASPAADGVPALLALGAQVELASIDGSRLLPLEAFITGVRKTALQNGEYLRGIVFPDVDAHSSSAFVKLGLRKYLVISIVMAAGVMSRDTTGSIGNVSLALGACSPIAVRLPELEAALVGKALKPATADCVGPEHIRLLINPIGDVRASAEYRAEAAVQVLRDAVRLMIERIHDH